MRRKLLSRDPAEVSIGCDGLAALRRSRHASSENCSSTILTRPSTSFSGHSMLLKHRSTPSSCSSETSTRSSTASSTKSSASSITSSGSSINITTSLAGVALRRLHTRKASLSQFLVSFRQRISSRRPPTTQLAQTHWILQPVEKKLPRLTPYWPEVYPDPIGAKENDRRWRTHIGTPWEGRYVNLTTYEYEQVSQNLPSCPFRPQENPEYLVKLQPPCATIGGDRYRCFKDKDKSWKMKYILEKMGYMADICGTLEPNVEVRGFAGLKYRDLLRMKYTNEIERTHKKPTEEISSDGIHIIRGFKPLSELENAQDHESLSHISFNTTHTPFPDEHRAMELASADLEVIDIHNQVDSLGRNKSISFQRAPQPKQAKGVARKSTPLEKLPPRGPPPRQRAVAKRRPIRQIKHVEDSDATPKASKRVRWSDEVEEKAPRQGRRPRKLGRRVDTVVHLPSRATSRQTAPVGED